MGVISSQTERRADRRMTAAPPSVGRGAGLVLDTSPGQAPMEWFLAVRSFDMQIAAVWLRWGTSGGVLDQNPLQNSGAGVSTPNCKQRANQNGECLYSAVVRTVYICLTPHRRPCPSRWLYPALPLRRGKVGDGGLVMVVTGRRK